MAQKRPVSENFARAFTSGMDGCRNVCQCGATHYDTHNHWDWNEGEMERLEEAHRTEPENYIPQDNSISSYIVDGQEFITGCPCCGGAKYEAFILRHARQIAAFLNARSEDLSREASSTKVKGVPAE